MNMGEDARRIIRPYAFSLYNETRKGLALFAEDGDNVSRRATAERDQDEFHGSVSCLGVTGIDNDGVPAAGRSGEAIVVSPLSGSGCLAHLLSPVIRLRLWMDEDAEELWSGVFEANL